MDGALELIEEQLQRIEELGRQLEAGGAGKRRKSSKRRRLDGADVPLAAAAALLQCGSTPLGSAAGSGLKK